MAHKKKKISKESSLYSIMSNNDKRKRKVPELHTYFPERVAIN